MRKIVLILSIAGLASQVSAIQEDLSSKNFIMTRVPLNETNTEAMLSYQFFDGLGRLFETAQGGHNTAGTYLCQVNELDALGRVVKKWLPIESSDPFQGFEDVGRSSTYTGYNSPYRLMTYDLQDRTLYATTPGLDNNIGKRYDYSSNTNRGEDSVKRYILTRDSIECTGILPAGSLTRSIVWDEDNKKTEVFKDLRGLTILERKNDSLDTYYIYNTAGQPRYVLTPNFQIEPILSHNAYIYEYDCRNRISEKTMPGCKPIKYWYDKADRLIFSQDREQYNQRVFRYYLYDSFDRLSIQGLCDARRTNDSIYSVALGNSVIAGQGIGYVIPTNAIPGNISSVELVRYYDDYSFLDVYQDEQPAYYNQLNMTNNISNANGLLTGEIKSTSAAEPVVSVHYYDNEGRISDTRSIFPGTRMITSRFQYKFSGDISEEQTVYRYNGIQSTDSIKTTQEYVYHAGTRLLHSRTLTIVMPNNQVSVISQSLSYDELGNLTGVDRNGTAADMSYQYDRVHGWLNTISSVGGFRQILHRFDDIINPLYNGSISSMEWYVPGEIMERKYRYQYDGANRLTEAVYSELATQSGGGAGPGVGDLHQAGTSLLGLVPSSNEDHPDMISMYSQTDSPNVLPPDIVSLNNYGEKISYDNNSNVVRLQRRGKTNMNRFGLIDNLEISYIGNQRTRIYDDASALTYQGASDFMDNSNEDIEYCYDSIGALTKDRNRGIDTILYDDLGHLLTIQFSGRRNIDYLYTADGIKLREVHSSPRIAIPIQAQAIGSDFSLDIYKRDTTDYMGSLILKKNHPETLLFDGGYLSFDHDTITGLHYYIQDYMGNNRMVVNRDGTIEQITHYYPYGGVIGDISTNENLQKFKFEGKELDRTFGLDNYDIHARNYFAMAPMWDRIDKKAEDYYGLSPYAYCEGDPVNRGDYDGDSVCVVLKSDGAGGVGHLAMLIQDEKNGNKWYLYSKNGYASSSSSESDVHGGVYSSPEEFLEKSKDEGYSDAFVMDTGKGKDKIAMDTMEAEINKPYSLLFSNCAHSVQNTLKAIGLSPGYYIPDYNNIASQSQEEFIIRNLLPITIFENIKKQNKGRVL